MTPINNTPSELDGPPRAVFEGDEADGDIEGTFPNALRISDELQQEIDDAIAGAGGGVSPSDLDAEEAARIATDNSLSGSLATTDSTVSGLSTNLTAEATARSSGDTAVIASSVQRGGEQTSVLDHGLSNNGNATAGTGTNNSSAWATLVAAINAGTYDNIYFPAGVYIFDADCPSITAANVRIHGAGASTILRAKSTAAVGTFFTVGNADGSTPAPSFVTIENFMMQCNKAGTGTEPTFAQNAVHLYDGGHLMVRNLIVRDVAGIVTVGTHTGTLNGTITSRSGNTLTMTAPHGLSIGDPLIFASTGNVPTGLVAGQLYYVLTTPTSSSLTVSLTSGGSVVALSGDGTGTRTWTGGAFNARVQRYQVQNVIGTLNTATTGASRIWILNGTSGFYSSFQCVNDNLPVGSDLNGGSVIKTQPISNNDQHWFTDVHFQGGEDYWFNCDVNSGDCYNWVFKQCVMDGSTVNGVWLHAERGANTVTDAHFVDCHCSTWGGTPILINHGGTQDWRSLQWIGGRYKWLNGDGSNYGAVRIGGSGAANILSANFQGCNFLADHLTITGLSASANTLSVTVAADGRGHGLNVGDKVVFNTTTNGITADTAYLVYSVSASGGAGTPNDTFQIQPSPATGTPVDITGSFSSSFTLQGSVNAMFTFTDAQGVRINSCHFGAFYGTPTYARYAVVAAGTANHYNVQGNVAVGLDAPSGGGTASFSDGSLVHDATLPQATVYFNNVSDVGAT